MEWIKTENQTPNDGEQVLCWYYGHQYKLLIWNDTYNCWDNEDGDDYFCSQDKVEYWTYLPKKP